MAALVKDLARAADSFEIQSVLKLLTLHFEAVKDELVICAPERVAELRGGAKAYRDFINQITRARQALGAQVEKING